MWHRAAAILSGGVLFLGAALAAEAQVSVTPSGPTALFVTDSTSTFTSVVTTNYSFTYYLHILNNGVLVDGHRWFITQSGPTFNFSSGPMSTSTWQLAVGNQIDYQSTVMITSTIGAKADWFVTVSQGTSMAPKPDGDWAFAAEALPPDRRLWSISSQMDPEERA